MHRFDQQLQMRMCSRFHRVTLSNKHKRTCHQSLPNLGKCADSINNYTCRCAIGFLSSQCDTNTNECGSDSTPCQNGAKFYVNNYTCLCAPVVSIVPHCHTFSNKKFEPPASDIMMMMKMMIIIIVVQAVVIMIISTILVVVCTRQRNKTRKSNDAELASRYETGNTSLLDNHIYSDITGTEASEQMEDNQPGRIAWSTDKSFKSSNDNRHKTHQLLFVCADRLSKDVHEVSSLRNDSYRFNMFPLY